MIVKVAHEATSFEIEYFERAVFTSSEKPPIIPLEVKSRDICRMSLEKPLLVQGLARVGLRYFVNLNLVVRSNTQIFTVCSHSKLVDLGRRRVNPDLHRLLARVDIPKLDRVVVAACDQQNLIFLCRLFLLLGSLLAHA